MKMPAGWNGGGTVPGTPARTGNNIERPSADTGPAADAVGTLTQVGDGRDGARAGRISSSRALTLAWMKEGPHGRDLFSASTSRARGRA